LSLLGLAGVGALVRDWTRSTQAYAAAVTTLEAGDIVIPAADRPYYEQLRDRLESTLDPNAFAGAWARGCVQSLEENVSEALQIGVAHPAGHAPEPPAPADARLSTRERQVAAHVAAGLTDKEIARRLAISPRTAEFHVANALAKLGLRSRAQLAAWVTSQALVNEIVGEGTGTAQPSTESRRKR
jgi:non-specific serine/threonine protein kinase